MLKKPNNEKRNSIEKLSERVGARIRKIRVAMGLKQADLGEKVGLPADRIQKYENGARKPKDEMLEKIAKAMDVTSESLLDPELATDLGTIFALFELEDLHDLKVKRTNGRVVLQFGDGKEGTLNDYINIWIDKRIKVERNIEESDSEEDKKEKRDEYVKWKMRFPKSHEEEIAASRAALINRQNTLQHDLEELIRNRPKN